MTTAAPHVFEAITVDVLWREGVVRPEPAELPKDHTAARIQLIQRQRSRAAAEEAEFILRLAELCPDEDDPPPDHPGAAKTYWMSARSEFPGVSEFFVDELAAVLGVGRGTAAHKAARAFTWRDSLPATFSALKSGELDERRAQILADTLEHTRPVLARRVEQVVLPEASRLGFDALKKRILAVLLELDPEEADERRELAQKNSDVWVEPVGDGRAVFSAEMDAEEAAEGKEFINMLAVMAKQDGDPRPIGQIRCEIHSLLIRGAALNAAGVRTSLTITAALESLEGTAVRPGEVNGHAITPAQLADLLRRVGALGVHAPDGGRLTFAITDADGRIIATLSLEQLQRRVMRGQGAEPPVPTGHYRPTAEQRAFVNTRDRGCRWPFCTNPAGWADHDHLVPHAEGGPTCCTNLCCLCRHHHRLKTFAKGWLFRMEPDGALHVTTPSGITRTTEPWAKRRRPPPPPPPDDPPPF